MLVIELPLPSRQLCGNAKTPTTRGGHLGRNRRVAEHRNIARLAGYVALRRNGWPNNADNPLWPSGRVAVRVVATFSKFWAVRALDDDNLWRGCKPYLDGLQARVGGIDGAGVVANDNQFYHVGPVTWAKVPPGQAIGLVLTLTPDD